MKVYRKPGGGVTFSVVDGYHDRHLELPCGKCQGCRLAKMRSWAIRLVHEAQMHEQNCFITLTYDDYHLPRNGGLNVCDWQMFAKRMRKAIGPFRFFHCGEYGAKNGRPHYHACIFGKDFSEDRYIWPVKQGRMDWRSDMLEKLWPIGQSLISDLTWDSAAYCAAYVMKKIGGDKAEEHYRRVDTDTGQVFHINPEHITMSRRPGLASTWFTKFWTDVYPEDVVVLAGGKRFRPPVFYDLKMEKKDPEMWEQIRIRRFEKASGQKWNHTWDRLRVREAVALAKQVHRESMLD